MSSDYEVKPLDLSPAGLQDCSRLLRRVFPHAAHLTEDCLDWQYNRNPAGTAIGFNAYRGDTLAAHYVTIPVKARYGGAVRPGVLSLNTATHPEHQGKKLFTILAERTYDRAAAAGSAFVVGVANANSTHGLTRKLGFQLVGPLEARLGVGRARWEEGQATPVGFDRVWDGDSMRWRLSNPVTSYRVVSEGSRFRVEAPTDRPGIKAHLGQFESELEPEGLGKGNIGFRPVTLWIGIDPSIRWSRSPYWSIPDRFRRSPLNLIFRSLGSGGPPLRMEDTRLRALDFDPY